MPFGPRKRRKKKKRKHSVANSFSTHRWHQHQPASDLAFGLEGQDVNMTRVHIHASAGQPRFRRMRRSIPGLAPIFGIMFTKSPKKKEILNLEVAKLDTVNNSQSALFSRDVKKAGRQCETGGIAGLAKRGGPRMSVDRDGGLEEKKKKGRYGQCFGDSRLAAMCEPRTHKQFRKAVLFARCRRHERSLGNARWVFYHFTTVWHRRVYFTGTYGNGDFGKAL